jgi:EAL domain-containing protein (putative c-di-GMP-specific phosphodiesterase class I)
MYEKRLRLEIRLRKAIKNQEFELYYQPKVDLVSGVIKGVEALIRWNSDDGFVFPGEFIPLAEETGLIIPLGEWCLAESCRQLKEWHQSDRVPISMSVNISAKQFTDKSFLPMLKQCIIGTDVDPRFLTLEITESLLIDDIDEKIKLLESIKEMGLKLSIDDFGTGYSSLSYLRRLPFDELKIDRSFIMEVLDHENSRAIVSTVAFLAQNLNMLTVAEGVEKKEELEFLKELGCDQFQGFLFSRAIPSNELFQMLPLAAVA